MKGCSSARQDGGLSAQDDARLRDVLARASSVAIVAQTFSRGSEADAEGRLLLNAGYRVLPVPADRAFGAWTGEHGSLAALCASGERPDIVSFVCCPELILPSMQALLAGHDRPLLVWSQGQPFPQDSRRSLEEAGMYAAQGESLAAVNAALFDESSPYFSCRRCGKCCEGRGGIVVSPRDLPRLCMFFGLPAETVLKRYTEVMRGQPVIRCGSDGYCMFFEKGRGCSIHPARPAVCRAWPFFRGNLVDAISFAMARQDCPGISKTCSHADFAEEGYRYLCEYKLRASDRRTEGRMLIVSKDDLPAQEH